MEKFEEQIHGDLQQYLLSVNEIDERLPECPDVEGKWEAIAHAYIPDGVREFQNYPLASLVAVFAIFWIRFYCSRDNFSDDQRRTARWFIRLSVFCAVVIVAVFIIHVGKFYLPLREPLYFWFVAGSFSLTAALTLLTVLGAAGIIVWLLIEWISSMRN